MRSGHQTRAFPAIVSCPVAVALALLATALLAIPAHAAEPGSAGASPLFSTFVDPAQSAGCHKAAEVRPALLADRPTLTQDFRGADARELKGVIDALLEQYVPDAWLVRVAVLPRQERAWAFQFASGGCHTVSLDLDVNALELVFRSAHVPSVLIGA